MTALHSHATIAYAAGSDLKTVSATLGHSAVGITLNLYVHAIETMQRSHADRLEATLGNAVATAIGGPPASPVPQPCHTQRLPMKKARKYRPNVIAPAGFEPALPP